jgi:hypothetical protein
LFDPTDVVLPRDQGVNPVLDTGLLPDTSTYNDVLNVLLAGARTKYDEAAAKGWVEVPWELSAEWMQDHIGWMGGWRLAQPRCRKL